MGRLVNRAGNQFPAPDYVDDDNIAVYKFTLGQFQSQATSFVVNNGNTNVDSSSQVIAGLRSSVLRLKVAATQELKQSDFYFKKFGGLTSYVNKGDTTVTNGTRFIDTLIKITGVQTGFSLELPVRFVKLK